MVKEKKLIEVDQKNSEAVLILLAYYNGEDFFVDQLESIFLQSYENIKVYISDDCSNLKPENIIFDMCYDISKVIFHRNKENLGYCKNFLSALTTADNNHLYYAFSDQDDIWYKDKISRAVSFLSSFSDSRPVLYCSRTEIFDNESLKSIGFSPLFKKKPSFENALVQNIAGGNTMVFNKPARDLIVDSTKNNDVVIHDWWCYQIITGAGGIVYYDSNPSLKYRQHLDNIVGANNSFFSRFGRLKRMLLGESRQWNDINLKALSNNKHLLTSKNQKILEDFITVRQSPLHARFLFFFSSPIYRQTFFGNMGLFLGLIFNRL